MGTVISSLSSLPSTGTTQKAPSNELGKDEFLRLLTTQLQHQDPLSPVDSQAFVAQLAQFAGVEQLEGLGKRLDTLLLAQASSNRMTVATLVGKEVTYHADRVTLKAGTPAPIQVALDAAADDVTAIVADGSGRVVRTLSLGAHSAGSFTASWDGLDDQGAALPSGDYVLAVSATRQDGTAVQSTASVSGVVHGVTFEDQSPELLVGGARVKLSDVVQIADPSPSA